MEWTYSVQGPASRSLRAARSLGIAVFDPVLQSNRPSPDQGRRRILPTPVDIDGVTGTVALLVPAPDAASKFAVDPMVLPGHASMPG